MAANLAGAKRNLEELATGRLPKLLLKFSWPALVAMSLNALYSVVDRFYIGQGCGEAAMAGLTLVFPIMMLFAAFGVFVGAGHAAAMSIKLGEGDRVGCEKILGQLVAFKLAFFFVLPPLVFFNIDTVLGWCGADGVSAEAFDCARRYLKIVLFSHLFSHLAFGFSALMRAEGSAIGSMTCMIVGFGTNLILDPIFIFGLGMGIAGAAWATNIAMAASCAFALFHYVSGRSVVRLRWRRIGFHKGYLAKPCGIGFAPFLQQLLGSLINVVLPAAFAKWSVDEAAATTQIASLGVFQSVMILVVLPVLGAQQGIQPIIGYNWGARNYRRVRDAYMLGFWVTTALCVIATVLQCVPPFPRILAGIFVSSDNPTLLGIAARDLQVANCMLWCIGLNVVATTFFQSIGRPKTAIVLSTLRQGACLLPAAWFLPYFFEDHAFGVWLSMPVSDVMCCLMTAVPIFLHMRFLSRVRARRAC
jgi:putative MATE family efflux protein